MDHIEWLCFSATMQIRFVWAVQFVCPLCPPCLHVSKIGNFAVFLQGLASLQKEINEFQTQKAEELQKLQEFKDEEMKKLR